MGNVSNLETIQHDNTSSTMNPDLSQGHTQDGSTTYTANTATYEPAEAEKFIKTLFGSIDAPLCFQTFQDCKDIPTKTGPRVLNGTFGEHQATLAKLNQDGHGIFVTINQTDGTGRKAENIVAMRAVFIDDDENAGVQFAADCPPSLISQSKNGVHQYWRLIKGEPLERFTPAQQQLQRYFKSDPKVKDLSRVMRLPGFFHQKKVGEKFMVRLLAALGTKFSLDQVLAAYPAPAPVASHPEGLALLFETPKRKKSAPVPVPDNVSGHDLRRAVALLAWAEEAVASEAEGSRNHTLFVKACLIGGLVGGGYLSRDEAEDALIDAGRACGLGQREAEQTAKNGLDRGEADPQGLPDDSDRKREWMIERGLLATTLSIADVLAHRARKVA